MRDPSELGVSDTNNDASTTRAAAGCNTSNSGVFEATYSLQNEDHTLGNCLRYQLNKNPGVALAGYSVPHPMERKVNVRVQTIQPLTADGAMREALLDVVSICEHVTETFEAALGAASEGAAPGGAARGKGKK